MIETIAVPDLTAAEQRGFWRRVAVRGSDECWPWLGGKHSEGYGEVYLRGGRYYAHRLAWSLYTGRGSELDGYLVIHTCDNPGCVSPYHLRRATAADNAQDMVRKGRGLRGERTGMQSSLLTRSGQFAPPVAPSESWEPGLA